MKGYERHKDSDSVRSMLKPLWPRDRYAIQSVGIEDLWILKTHSYENDCEYHFIVTRRSLGVASE